MYVAIGVPILATLTVVGGVVGISVWYHNKKEDILYKELEVEGGYRKKAQEAIGVDGSAMATATTFDVLYNTFKMDPRVLEGIDSLHHARDFESLGDVQEYINNSILEGNMSSQDWERVADKYKGYTGEEHVFDGVSNENLQVPESGTHEGYDAVIGGTPVDVKTTADPQVVNEYLDTHPPNHKVVAPRELSEEFGDHPRVIIDESLSATESYNSTLDTMEGISDLGDAIEMGPVIALATNTLKNAKRVNDGTKDVDTAVEHTALDTVGKGAGAVAGGKLGLTAGLALAPVTGGASAIIIPAASSFLGTVMGVLTGGGISGWVKERHLREAKKKLGNKARRLRNSFLKNLQKILDTAELFYRSRIEFVSMKEEEKGANTFIKFLFPSVKSLFFMRCRSRLKEEAEERGKYYINLAQKVRRKEPKEGGMIIFTQGKAILNGVEPLPSVYDSVEQRLEKVREEKKKLE